MKSFFNYAKNRILYNIFRFLFFLIVALILLSSKVNALESDFTNLSVQGYNNNGTSLTAPSVFNCNEDGSCGMEITTVANSYGGAWGIQSPIPLLKNNNYSISLRIRSSYSDVVLSSKFYLALGNSHANAKANYENSTYWNTLKYYKSAGNSILQYVFTADTNASYIVIPFTTVTNMTGSFMIDTIIVEDLGSQSLTQDQINNVINNQTSIIQNDINNLQDEFNNTINDTFTSCESEKNLFNSATISNGDISGSFPDIRKSSRQVLWLDPGTYTFSTNLTSPYQYVIQINDISPAPTNGYPNYILDTSWINNNRTFTINKGGWFVLGVRKNDNSSFNLSDIMNYNYQLEKGNSASSYIPYKEVCKNKLDSLNDTQKETNDKLEEANKTSKGIWDTLKELPKTILDGFLDLLLKVFVPEDDFFSNWFDEVKSMFEEQLGFLATPFTIIIEFIERFLDLNSSTDIIINIPDITVPNFENITLIKATSFNWSSLLNSKDSLKNLWTLYLDFIDVFLILNFIGLCSSIYGRIFGGDTSNFEYYTVEDTYTVNDSTGEVTNHRLNQRKTTRKKVN